MVDPFHILNLEQTYALDQQLLEQHYFEEQKKCHPDQFSQVSAQEKADAVKKSAAVNQAYLMLKNPLNRAEYLLKAAGFEMLSHEPSFLGTVMEWNERLEQGEDLNAELLSQEKTLFHALEGHFARKDYEKIRTVLYQLTYVQKLLKQSEGL
jgi:molecular chaperone HscB